MPKVHNQLKVSNLLKTSLPKGSWPNSSQPINRQLAKPQLPTELHLLSKPMLQKSSLLTNPLQFRSPKCSQPMKSQLAKPQLPKEFSLPRVPILPKTSMPKVHNQLKVSNQLKTSLSSSLTKVSRPKCSESM